MPSQWLVAVLRDSALLSADSVSPTAKSLHVGSADSTTVAPSQAPSETSFQSRPSFAPNHTGKLSHGDRFNRAEEARHAGSAEFVISMPSHAGTPAPKPSSIRWDGVPGDLRAAQGRTWDSAARGPQERPLTLPVCFYYKEHRTPTNNVPSTSCLSAFQVLIKGIGCSPDRLPQTGMNHALSRLIKCGHSRAESNTTIFDFRLFGWMVVEAETIR